MSNTKNDIQNLSGQILLATPNISDAYMQKSMVFICQHSIEGAIGVTINKIIPDFSFMPRIALNEVIGNVKIHMGGNYDLDNCYILHTNQNLYENTIFVYDKVFLTTCGDILKSLAFMNNEPERKILSLGCYRWDPQQLEEEIALNYWIPIPADEALIFGDPLTDKWSKAFLKIGLRSPLFLDRIGTA